MGAPRRVGALGTGHRASHRRCDRSRSARLLLVAELGASATGAHSVEDDMTRFPTSERPKRRALAVAITLTLTLTVAGWFATAPPASALPDGFQDELLWSGFVNP